MLPQVLTLALEEKARKSRAKDHDVEQTLRTGKTHCGHLERILGADLDLNDPGTNLKRVGEYYLDQRGREYHPKKATLITPHTISKEIGTLRQGLGKAWEYDLFAGKPSLVMPDALKRGIYTPRKRWLPLEEFVAIRAEATPYRRPWLDIAVETGIDLGELAKIHKKQDLDFSTVRGKLGAIHVPGKKAEGRDRWIALSKAARAAVDERLRVATGDYLFRPVWTSSNFKRRATKWCAHTGVEMFIYKDLRRTFASRLCQAGVPEFHTIKLMGHKSSKMIREVYAQLSPGTYEEAITRLDALPYTRHADVIDLGKVRENAGTLKDKKCENR
jgi:integrase